MKKAFALTLFAALLCSCGGTDSSSSGLSSSSLPSSSAEEDPFETEVVYKELSKEEYRNKTLGGLLGQFAGFLSGYEFVWSGSEPRVAMPLEWFDFLNGPYAGNYEHYFPGDYATGDNIYDRLKENPETGLNEVWSDDDYHIDIFNQTIIDEFGTSAKAVMEAWKKYRVSDWGGGSDAMNLIAAHSLLAPYTGTIEAGNRYGWCTEAYIENETLGMNAPGMPSLAVSLIDTFASNVGYFDSLIWAKFYGAMYSLAYFESDVAAILEEASKVLPKYSRPYEIYEEAVAYHSAHPDDFAGACRHVADMRMPLYRIDNIQTDPNVNGGMAIVSWLYGNGDYLDSCMYSSLAGYDGDCTSAIVTGLMGVIHGFKEGNEEYEELNSTIYYDGEGVYYNDRSSGYPPFIMGESYPERMKIDEIVDLYVGNFEKLLLEQGGEIGDESYLVPTSGLIDDASLLFPNHGAEERSLEGFEFENGTLEAKVESTTERAHSGWGYFELSNAKEGRAYHRYENLVPGAHYRVSAYLSSDGGEMGCLYAEDEAGNLSSSSFSDIGSTVGRSFVFEATSSSMDVGIRFDEGAPRGAKLYFDDFYLERVDYRELSPRVEKELSLANGNYMKTVDRPSSLKEGAECYLALPYRNYAGNSLFVSVYRNGSLFGSVQMYSNAENSLSGESTLYIPYVFEKESDVVKLEFDARAAFGNFYVLEKNPLMFR